MTGLSDQCAHYKLALVVKRSTYADDKTVTPRDLTLVSNKIRSKPSCVSVSFHISVTFVLTTLAIGALLDQTSLVEYQSYQHFSGINR